MPKHTLRNDSPFPFQFQEGHFAEGMTMREWYAGMAMQGALASMKDPDETCFTSAATLAEHAFGYADAMLAEAAKERPA